MKIAFVMWLFWNNRIAIKFIGLPLIQGMHRVKRDPRMMIILWQESHDLIWGGCLPKWGKGLTDLRTNWMDIILADKTFEVADGKSTVAWKQAHTIWACLLTPPEILFPLGIPSMVNRWSLAQDCRIDDFPLISQGELQLGLEELHGLKWAFATNASMLTNVGRFQSPGRIHDLYFGDTGV
jgi:hypothetical protein